MRPEILKKLKEWRNSPLQFVTECIGVTPSKQQAHALRLLPKTKRLTIRSGHGCHAPRTLIHLYPYGLEFVENIKVDDYLMGDDGTPRRVLELYEGEEEMARIRYHDGTYYDVNMSHKLALVCTGSKQGYRTGEKVEMTVRDYLDLPDYMQRRFAGYKVAVDYPEFPLLIPPYIMGLWLGDGTKGKAEITNIDMSIIGSWHLYAQSMGLHVNTDSNGKLHRMFTPLSGGKIKNPFIKMLEHYGLIEDKHIPQEYIYNSMENRLELLAGLVDTDGYVDKRNNSHRIEISQKREDIAEDIVFIAQSCGMHATVKPVEKSWVYAGQRNTGLYYLVSITRNVEMIPTRVERKWAPLKAVNKQRPNLHFGFKVEKLPVGKYYGFEVDKNHLYVLGDFTVTRNTGKDAFAAWAILWFMSTRTYPKAPCTAPTGRQLSDVLWSELSKWLRQSKVADEFVLQKDKLFHKDAKEEWWARAISPSVKATKEEQAETLAGLHADHMLIVVDEASGVFDPVYVPLEGAMTQEDNRVILIGNMTKNTGYFFDTHFHPTISSKWTKLHWDSRDSELVSKEMINYFAEKYGENSNTFKIRVMGDPPVDDLTTFIPLSWSLECVGNEVEVDPEWPLYLSADIARYGDDDSVVLPRRGMKVDRWETFQGMHTINLAYNIRRSFLELKANGVVIDEIGIGAGVVDWLQNDPRGLGRKAIGLNVAESSSDPKKWYRIRDELWDRVRENVMNRRYSFPDEMVRVAGRDMNMGHILADELSSVKYNLDNNVLKIESKRDMKARGLKSPNIADALVMSEYFSNEIAFALWSPREKDREVKRRFSPAYPKRVKSNSWITMG